MESKTGLELLPLFEVFGYIQEMDIKDHQDWFHTLLQLLNEADAFDNDRVIITNHVKDIVEHIGDAANNLNRIRMAADKLNSLGFATFDGLENFGQVYGGVKYDLTNTPIQGKLHFDGLKYLVETANTNKLTASQIKTDENVRGTNVIMRRTGIVSAIIAGLATIYIIKDFYSKHPETQKETKEELQQKVPLLDSTQRSQKAIDSSPQKAVTDSSAEKQRQ